MKKILLPNMLVLLALVFMTGNAMALIFNNPTGVIKNDSEKAYQGYTLFTPLTGVADDMYTWLIDMDGNVVHKWKFDDENFTPFYYGTLLENGNLLRGLRPYFTAEGIPTPSRRALNYQPTGTIFQEVDWHGNIVWQGRHPDHRDVTAAEFQALTGLTDDEMKDPDTVKSTMSSIEARKGIGNELARMFNYSEHHDMLKIWNSKIGKYTLLFIANKNVDPKDVRTSGFIGEAHDDSFPDSVSVDVIAEIDMETGELVWEWWLWDRLIQNTDPSLPNYAQDIADRYYGGDLEEAFYRRFDVNTQSTLGIKSPRKDWVHFNSLDYHADLGLIVVNSRDFAECYIINHNTTTEEAKGPAGDFLWRFGTPSNYASERQLGEDAKAEFPTLFDAMYSQLWAAHDVQWVDAGLPGEGNLLIYNNGQGRVGPDQSDVFEINPFDEYGHFVRELDAGYARGAGYASGRNAGETAMNRTIRRTSNLIVWGFTGGSKAMHSRVMAGAQRLPNGNTLICVADSGHIVEVTQEGEVVWEYLLPVFNGYYSTNTGIDGEGNSVITSPSGIFRAHRFAPDFIGLKNRTLRPQGQIGEVKDWTGFGFGGIGGSPGGGGGGGGGGAAGGGY